jgi:hypothetical protein
MFLHFLLELTIASKLSRQEKWIYSPTQVYYLELMVAGKEISYLPVELLPLILIRL